AKRVLVRCPCAVDEGAELLSKEGGRKLFGMRPQPVGIEIQLRILEPLHDLAYGLSRLLVEMQPGNSVSDGLTGAALPERQHRSTACARFERSDAEVLLGREYECLRLLQMLLEHFERLVTEELHVAGCNGFCLLELRAVTNNDQVALWHSCERFDN